MKKSDKSKQQKTSTEKEEKKQSKSNHALVSEPKKKKKEETKEKTKKVSSKKHSTKKGLTKTTTHKQVTTLPRQQPTVQETSVGTPTTSVVEKPKIPKIKLVLKDGISPQEIAEKINKPVSQIITELMKLGVIVSATQKITDSDTIELLFSSFGYEVEISTVIKEEPVVVPEVSKPTTSQIPTTHTPVYVKKPETKPEKTQGVWVKKIPVVTVMGHVDHGKTTLLDTIRKTNIVATEFGQITQHIGAYKVKTSHGEITFIDTPGHAAFSSLRARGAKVTDIVVLVVAGDEGVMPQTLEAIDHIKFANVPFIVAVNKIDLPTCNVQKVKQQFSQMGFIPRDWGGEIEFVEISARNNINIDKLLDTILFTAEMMDLQARIDIPSESTVIETKLDPKRGSVATVICSKGKLKIGDSFICNSSYGKVRAMFSWTGERINELLPGEPAEILGFAVAPTAGDIIRVVENEKVAKEIFEEQQEQKKLAASKIKRTVSFEDILSAKERVVSLVIKTDTQGSAEAIKKMLSQISEELKNNPNMPELRIVHIGIGEISDTDVLLASASKSVVVGFNVRPATQTIKTAKQEAVEIRTYRIIYELIDDIRKILQQMEIKPQREEVVGRALVKKVFNISKVGRIAGCVVEEGKVVRNIKARVLRDNVIIAETKISSLKHFKEDVKEVLKGYECGIGLENFTDIKENDVIECYQIITEDTQSLSQ